MKYSLNDFLSLINMFLFKAKDKIITFIFKNWKFILPIVIILFIIDPKNMTYLIFSIFIFIILFVLLFFIIKKMIVYSIATGLFIIRSFIGIIAFVLCLGLFVWIAQLLG